MSIDTKNDLDIRCDAVQKVSTAIAKLRTEDIEKVVDFVELLKAAHEKQKSKSVVIETEYISALEDLTNVLHVRIESLRAAIESLFNYFMYDGTNLNDDLKQEILINYETHRKICGIALDYAASVDDFNKALRKVLQDLKKDSKELTE